mmetsp:Transcript_34357/g.28976  ORF Transcript_34357/g.28976 Transcript_34357/m.28976 type:complete len:163 (-) Transcript_34357:347-835(-)|eukprot:CAMPEP_0179430408 /NCGR_PEP_ID=MMETSP0799-20121207/15559_1 /TAXON_ID=46947 /ORGANISM="Geminigera cryophila, Strain CCMP2564" /LENGTH=162 /DNA_ID=CAMNT_0021206831 /DNA_START=6 /DNA_END=494 /DNA_ORIENTATION=-
MSEAMSIATSLGPSGCDDTDSVQSQIVWCNVDTEVLSKNFVRLNSSCSPNFVAPGLSALIHSREARAPRLSLDGSNERQPTDGDRRPSTSGVTVENAQVKGGGPPPSLPDADGIRKKTGRELWMEEEERLRKLELENPPVLVMGSAPMCNTGGCGYFSDDGK